MIYLFHATLKVLNLGSKLNKFSEVLISYKVRTIVAHVGMLALVECSLTKLYAPLLSTFVGQ